MKPLFIDLNYTFTDAYNIKFIDTEYFKNTHHFHKDYELVVVLESSGKRIIGDNIENFDNGDIVFIGPNLSHGWFNDKEYYESNENLKAKSVVIYLKKDWIENLIMKLPENDKVKKCLENASRGIKVNGKSQKKIYDIISKIQHSEGFQKAIDILTILSEISNTQEYDLLASPNYLTSYNQHEERRIQQVYEYVVTNFSNQIKLKEVASIANISPNAFCRYFKAKTHKNFSIFVNEIRINHACKLLHQKNFSISYVCHNSGFQSLTNFNKFFKKITGKSPMEFRKEINNIY